MNYLLPSRLELKQQGDPAVIEQLVTLLNSLPRLEA